jgi:hypothetical protein
VIRELFERIAAGERAAEVAEWLDSIKFAKAKWARQAKWTAGNVNAIVRRTKYRGFETNRVKVSKRKLRTASKRNKIRWRFSVGATPAETVDLTND